MQLPPNQLAEIDAALRLVDREVWIVTAADGGRRGGLLATAVSSVSIDPERPILLAGISANHFTAELVQASRAFAAHLLRPEQVELAWNFARDSGRARDKLADLVFEQRQTGSPILTDCVAWFDCRVIGRYDAGDRLFFWADVVGGGQVGRSRRADRVPRSPKAMRESQFFMGLTTEQRQTLVAARKADTAAGRPLHERWRSENPW